MERDEEDDGDWTARYEPDAMPMGVNDISSSGKDDGQRGDNVLVAETREHDQQKRAVLGDQCAICLHALDDPVMLQGCHHVYCLACLSSWVRNLVLHGVREPTCPLCKRVFHAAYADVVSETDYHVVHFDGRSSRRRDANTARQDGAQRRSMVYANRMRLARVNGVDARGVDSVDKLPAPVKTTAREFSEWLERELRACVGPHVDLTVLFALIDGVLGAPIVSRRVDWRALEATLAPFLLDDTALFVRELAFFLASRLNMHAYDDAIQYCCASSEGDGAQCAIPSCAANHSI